jgi:hypothetical protein
VRKGPFVSVVGAVLLAFVMGSGCGSDSSSTALTKAQFVKQGNAICKEWEAGRNAAIAAVGQKFSGKTSNAAKEKAILMILSPYEEAIGRLEELSAPSGDDAQIEAILASMHEAAGKVKADPGTALVSGLPFRQANKRVEDYGLNRCEA